VKATVKAKADRAVSKMPRPAADPKRAADRADVLAQARLAARHITESAQDSLEQLNGWLKPQKRLPDDAVRVLTDALLLGAAAFGGAARAISEQAAGSADASGRK
jgi:hypothetical protein